VALSGELSIEPGESWAVVPLSFPYGPWRNVEDWADTIRAELGRTYTEDVPDAFVDAVKELARQRPPLDGAAERYLWLGDLRTPLLAHLYVADDAASIPDVRAVVTAGIGGFAQTLRQPDPGAFSQLLEAVLVFDLPDGGTAFGLRWLGIRGDRMAILDLLTDQPAAIAFAQPDAEALFRSLSFR